MIVTLALVALGFGGPAPAAAVHGVQLAAAQHKGPTGAVGGGPIIPGVDGMPGGDPVQTLPPPSKSAPPPPPAPAAMPAPTPEPKPAPEPHQHTPH